MGLLDDMRSVAAFSCLLASVIAAAPASATGCSGNSYALGTSRTIVVDPLAHNRLGSFQYAESLPLNDKEVVITFDDGPLPPYSTRILDLLAKDCVKATFFLVGKMARVFPKVVRRMHEEGHTLANHSDTHPYNFHTMAVLDAAREIESAHASIVAAVGDPAKVSPFFRFPGLHRQDAVERYLQSKGMMSWSVDFMADDWTRIGAGEIVKRALARLEQKGKGILLLHDIKPATALGLPMLISELKARGYKVVHVVPASADRPATVTTAEQWQVRNPPTTEQLTNREPSMWPKAAPYRVTLTEAAVEAPSLTSFGADATGAVVPIALVPALETPGDGAQKAAVAWPEHVALAATSETDVLPVPAMHNFRYTTTTRRRARSPTNGTANAAATNSDVTGSVNRSAARGSDTKSKSWTANSNKSWTANSNKNSNNTSNSNDSWAAKNKAWAEKANQWKKSKNAGNKNAGKPGSKGQTGHQIQIPAKPQASLQPSR